MINCTKLQDSQICSNLPQGTGHHLVAGKRQEGSSAKIAEVLDALPSNGRSSSVQGWKLFTCGFLKPGLREIKGSLGVLERSVVVNVRDEVMLTPAMPVAPRNMRALRLVSLLSK